EWSIDLLPPGKTEYLTITVNNIGDNAAAWQNTAVVSSAELDTDFSDNVSTITATSVSKWTNMQVTKSVNPAQPTVGQNMVFTVTATRIAAGGGSQSADNVRVIDLLPSGYAYVSHTASAGTY